MAISINIHLISVRRRRASPFISIIFLLEGQQTNTALRYSVLHAILIVRMEKYLSNRSRKLGMMEPMVETRRCGTRIKAVGRVAMGTSRALISDSHIVDLFQWEVFRFGIRYFFIKLDLEGEIYSITDTI
jgi:hypothetical protein